MSVLGGVVDRLMSLKQAVSTIDSERRVPSQVVIDRSGRTVKLLETGKKLRESGESRELRKMVSSLIADIKSVQKYLPVKTPPLHFPDDFNKAHYKAGVLADFLDRTLVSYECYLLEQKDELYNLLASTVAAGGDSDLPLKVKKWFVSAHQGLVLSGHEQNAIGLMKEMAFIWISAFPSRSEDTEDMLKKACLVVDEQSRELRATGALLEADKSSEPENIVISEDHLAAANAKFAKCLEKGKKKWGMMEVRAKSITTSKQLALKNASAAEKFVADYLSDKPDSMDEDIAEYLNIKTGYSMSSSHKMDSKNRYDSYFGSNQVVCYWNFKSDKVESLNNSAVIWNQLKSLQSQVKEKGFETISRVTRIDISNKETLAVVTAVLSRTDKLSERECEFAFPSDEALALLNTPNGLAAFWLAYDHFEENGSLKPVSIKLFEIECWTTGKGVCSVNMSVQLG